MRPATYTQIREYVKELHGVSVHTSHIAEVKRKCGLDMRKNYNVSKKNAPKKPCTKEKEAYIKEALRHFGMI
jgi:transposase